MSIEQLILQKKKGKDRTISYLCHYSRGQHHLCKGRHCKCACHGVKNE